MDAKLFQRAVVFLAVLGICTPQMALAATTPSVPAPTNVQLREGGVLLGQVVTPEHVAVANTTVSLRSQAGEAVAGKTDKNGYFAFRGLRSGVYRVAAAKGQRDVRVWSPSLAPPVAESGIMIVAGTDALRAQCGPSGACGTGGPCGPCGGGGGLMGFLTSPLGLGLIVATAVAVPVAIHNSKKPGTS